MIDAARRSQRIRRAGLGPVASALAAALLASSAVAQPPEGRIGPPGMAHPGSLERHADRLGLDEEARVKIRAVVGTTHSSTQSREAERAALFERLEQLLKADEPDEAQVLQVAEQLGALELADHKDRLLAMLAIRSVLTPEQRVELLEIHKEPRGRRRSSRLGPCSRDADRLCADAEPGRATLRCLDLSWDGLSGHCRRMFERTTPPARLAPAD